MFSGRRPSSGARIFCASVSWRRAPINSTLTRSCSTSARNCSWSAEAPASTRLPTARAVDADRSTSCSVTASFFCEASVRQNASFTSRSTSSARLRYSHSAAVTSAAPIFASSAFLPGNGTVWSTPAMFCEREKPPLFTGTWSAVISKLGFGHKLAWMARPVAASMRARAARSSGLLAAASVSAAGRSSLVWAGASAKATQPAVNTATMNFIQVSADFQNAHESLGGGIAACRHTTSVDEDSSSGRGRWGAEGERVEFARLGDRRPRNSFGLNDGSGQTWHFKRLCAEA